MIATVIMHYIPNQGNKVNWKKKNLIKKKS